MTSALLMLFTATHPCWAQTMFGNASLEVSGAAGLAHVFRFDDQSYDDGALVSIAAALRHRRGLGVELEMNRAFGLTAAPAPCGLVIDGVPAVCVGDAHEGVRGASVAALTLHYRFGRGRVQPYVLAGVGVLRTRSVWSVSVVDGNRVVQTEQERRDTGIGLDVGAGLSIAVTQRVALRPEVRWLEGAVRSPLNLSSARVSLRVAYGWR